MAGWNFKEKNWKSGLGISVYYKFKINYNESELSLSCLDKDMIEREMDLYFAFFADASEEFISKIKKIKKIPPKIRSIDKIVDSAVSEKLPLSNEKIEFALKTDILQQQLNEVQEYLQESKIEKQSIPLDEKIAFPTIIETENEVENEISTNTQIDNIQETDEDITKKFGFDKLEPDFSPQYSEIQNMIKLAQNKIEAQDLKQQIISEDTSDNLLKHFANDIEEIEDYQNDENSENKFEINNEVVVNEQKDNEEFLNNIFSKNNLEENEITHEIKTKSETLEAEEEAVVNAKMNINEFLQMGNKFQNSIDENFEVQQPSETELQEFANNLDSALNDSIKAIGENNEEKPETSKQINLIENIDEDLKEDKTKQFEVKEDDFGKFLSIFNPITLRDDFLLCAYFIKDILMKPSFTMKSINAKLYKATGSIAGISLLEELMDENLIIQLQNDFEERKEYTISNLGERYIQDNFQRQ